MRTMTNIALSVMILALVLSAPACKKKQSTPPAATVGSMNLRFDYVFGANMVPWELNKTYVHTKTFDTLTFTTFKFYVSNIRLKKTDGTWWAQPESYHLVDAGVANGSTISITNVPVGEYTTVEYMMGIDSLHNVSGSYTGALSLSNAMFWDWNSGYIMLKAEGKSPNAPNGGFAFHLGGFSGDNNIITVKTADLAPATLTISGTKTPVVKLTANPARLWHSSPSVSVNSVIHMPGATAKTMAKDFYNNISYGGME